MYFYRRIFTRRVRISLAEPSAECSALGFVLFPIGNRYLRWFRTLVAVVCAAALVYSESWLPGLDSIRGNFHNLAAMESGYLLDSALNFLNFEMIGAGIALIIIYYAIRDYIRVTTFTVGYLFILLCAPLWRPLWPSSEHRRRQLRLSLQLTTPRNRQKKKRRATSFLRLLNLPQRISMNG